MTTAAVDQELMLAGCRPAPLASYLSAVGVLRLVAEQVDRDARGRWTPTGFALTARLSQEGLEDFLLDDYRPSPVVSPWNGGSGFEKGTKGPEALRRVRDSALPRLEGYAATIRAAEGVLQAAAGVGLTKDQLVRRCRAVLPDEALPWLDAAVVLGGERGVEYPPLLGTGGNDGRLDFSVAFLGRLAEVLRLAVGRSAVTRERSRSWLRGALLAEPTAGLPAETPGQFSPGSLGGVGSGPGADEARTNPWQFVLLVEGALAFAAAAARRLGAATGGRAVMPFTFELTSAGYASSATEDARAEVWMPLWDRPATFPEVDRVLREGRSSWRGRQARTGLDAARSAATLGVDRGVSAFERYGLLTRNGLATLAVPLGRMRVADRSVPAVGLASALDPWVGRISSARNPPAAVEAGVRAVTKAQLAIAQSGTATAAGHALLRVLVAAADLEQAVGRSIALRAGGMAPPPALPAGRWLPLVEPSAELWLAAALASLRDKPPRGGPSGAEVNAVDALATLIRPVVRQGRRMVFSDIPPSARHQPGSVAMIAAAAVRRGLLRAGRSAPPELEASQVGSSAWYDLGLPVRLADAQALLDGALDEERLGTLVRALAMLTWDGERVDAPRVALTPPSYELAILLPFQVGGLIRRNAGGDEVALRPGAGWGRRLAAGDIAGVLADAALRLRLAGVALPAEPAPAPRDVVRGGRLAALSVLRVAEGVARRLLDQLDPLDPLASSDVADGAVSPSIDDHLEENA